MIQFCANRNNQTIFDVSHQIDVTRSPSAPELLLPCSTVRCCFFTCIISHHKCKCLRCTVVVFSWRRMQPPCLRTEPTGRRVVDAGPLPILPTSGGNSHASVDSSSKQQMGAKTWNSTWLKLKVDTRVLVEERERRVRRMHSGSSPAATPPNSLCSTMGNALAQCLPHLASGACDIDTRK